MVDLGTEEHLWSDHWVVSSQEKLKLKHASLVWAVSWAGNLNEEVSVVLV